MKQFVELKKAVVMILATVLLGSCMNDDPIETVPTAGLIIFNAYSPIPSTQALISDRTSGQIAYSANPGYFEFPNVSGQNITFINQTTNQVLVDRAALPMELNRVYTAIVFGNAVPAKFIFLSDSAIQNASTNPRIRFLNLAEGVQAVDLFIGNEKIESLSNRNPEVQANISQSEAFILSGQSARAADITVRDLEGNILATLPSHNFSPSGYYTIMLVGDHAFNDQSPNVADRTKALKIVTYLQ